MVLDSCLVVVCVMIWLVLLMMLIASTAWLEWLKIGFVMFDLLRIVLSRLWV